MTVFNVGIRKYVERSEVQYWLVINAKPEQEESVSIVKKTSKRRRTHFNESYWRIFLVFTILVNLLGSSLFMQNDKWLYTYMILIHLTCFFYWIDFVVDIVRRIRSGERKNRYIGLLIVDAISLIPLSAVYLMIERNPDKITFTYLRFVTFLRFHKVYSFFHSLTMSVKLHWKLMIINCLIIFVLTEEILCCYAYSEIDNFSPIAITHWNKTSENKKIVSFYFTSEVMFAVGFGDIVPAIVAQESTCLLVAVLSCFQLGIMTGILTTAFANSDRNRENYRDHYNATMKALKGRNIDKKTLDRVSENMITTWKYRKGSTDSTIIEILPMSMQKEVCFDINFGFLYRSLIFSDKPRSFLRSVSIFMKNVSYLPGDIICEPFQKLDAMLCVASGVIEVFSEENDESVLFSLTSGTIIGEASLFISISTHCRIRAATYVELQVLTKVNFSRLALKYPETVRSMRSDIYYRLRFRDSIGLATTSIVDSEFVELLRRKETKRFLKDLRNRSKNVDDEKQFRLADGRQAILSLYVLSENIPTVKTLPITLIRARPWILRPNTPFTNFWEIFVVLLVTSVVFIYPFCAAFVRVMPQEFIFFMYFVEGVYVFDLYITCTTAIQNKDNFTFTTSIKEIIAYRLKTFGFYMDIFATYDFSVLAVFKLFGTRPHTVLLLSLNRLLKIWRVFAFFYKLEEDIRSVLLVVRTIKYFFIFSVAFVWVACFMYIEACPSKSGCDKDRWFAHIQMDNVDKISPIVLSFYFAVSTMSGVSFGDISAACVMECLMEIVFFSTGIIILDVCMSQASATFKHLASTMSSYQSEVFAVNRFITEHEIPESLKKDVRNYLQLQWNYDQGFTLMRDPLNEGHSHQSQIVITDMELVKFFLAVPMFRAANIEFLKLLVRLSRVWLLPPNDVITDIGSIDREMFILESGFCEVSVSEQESMVIGPVNSFGFYEMINGTPIEVKVRTLTHVKVITVSYTAYLRAVTKYPSVKSHIDNFIENYSRRITKFDTLAFKPTDDTIPKETAISQQKLLSKQFINVYKYNAGLSLNYWQPFKDWGRLRFFQFFLLPIVIAPDSLFIKIWSALRIINVTLIGIFAPIYFSLRNHSHQLFGLIVSLQVFSLIDMYLMFHVAYYDTRGLLMFHPAKTATWYLKGNFIVDLLTLFPYFWFFRTFFPPENDAPNLLYDGSGLVIVLQFYKFIQGCYYWENNILRKSEVVKPLKFIPLALVIMNFTTGLMVLTECTNYVANEKRNETNRLPAEWKEGINIFCTQGAIPNDMSNRSEPIFKMYLTTLYWVTQSMTSCGFGDISPNSNTSVIAIMIIVVIGIFLYGYMYADLTSGMITAYVLVSKYRRRIKEMSTYLEDKNIDGPLHLRMVLHYEYNWQRTEGANPQKIFARFHASLRQSIMASIYGDTVQGIPEFANVGNSIIREIGQNLDEMYFLEGETIVNYNDVVEHIYLLYRGTVKLLTKEGDLIATMGRGGLFGNISNTPFFLSSVMVVASENVDVLRFNCKIFFKALQLSPHTMPLLKALTSKKRDYIIPLADAPYSGVEPDDVETIPYEITATRTLRPVRNYTQPNLADQSSLHFKNSLFRINRGRPCTFVILPETIVFKVLEIMVVIFAYFSSVLTMYVFAFQHVTTPILVLCYALDFMFYVKIGLEYHMSYFDKFGDYVVGLRVIAKRYHKSKTFIYDIVSNLPLEIFALAGPSSWQLTLFATLRLNRLIRLGFISQYHQLKLQTLMVNKTYLEFWWILIWTTLMTHFFACLWLVVACPLGKCITPCFVSEMDLQNKEKFEVYQVSLHYSILIMTTLAFSGIRIYSKRELILCVVMMVSSRFALVFLIGTLAAAFQAQNHPLFLYQEKIFALKERLIKQKTSEYQIRKIWNYVTFLWFYKAGSQIPKFITSAPYTMRCEVMNKMFGSHLSQSYIFGDLEQHFIRQLSIYLKRSVFFPGNYIVQQGDTDHTMYFIHIGELSPASSKTLTALINPNCSQLINL